MISIALVTEFALHLINQDFLDITVLRIYLFVLINVFFEYMLLISLTTKKF
jgi:hypothetical protein